MKSVLISIQPKWCELIASGKKTVEVRKTKPKLETPFKVYIYETQGITETPFIDEEGHHIFKGRGQVIGEFVCDSIDQYDYGYCTHPEIGMDYDCGDNWWEIAEEDLENACLTYEDFKKYAYGNKVMYGWHISDLVIYDEPRELREFVKYRADWEYRAGIAALTGLDCNEYITRPPQSWNL